MKPPVSHRSKAAIGAFLVTASTAWAHPGHLHPVTPPASAWHWFLEPEHLLGWIGVACVAAAFWRARTIWAGGSTNPKRRKN